MNESTSCYLFQEGDSFLRLFAQTADQAIGTSSLRSFQLRISVVARSSGATMLKYAIIFALIAVVAGALGFGGVAAGAAGIAKILFGLFLVLAVVFLLLAALGVGAVKKAIDQ